MINRILLLNFTVVCINRKLTNKYKKGLAHHCQTFALLRYLNRLRANQTTRYRIVNPHPQGS